MHRILRRTLLAVVAIILFLGLGAYSYHQIETRQRLRLYQAQVASTFQGVALGYQEFADVVSDWVLSDPVTLALIGQLTQDDPIARGLLYRRLAPLYESLRVKHVRQLHIVGRDGRSLLRMHAPEKSGDDLRHIRPLLLAAMARGKPMAEFENGRLMSGFRYVYPIRHAGEILGAIEVSLSFSAIRRLLARELGDGMVVRFLLERRDLLRAMGSNTQHVDSLFASLYEPARLHPGYVTENLAHPLFDESPEVLPVHAEALERRAGESPAIRQAMAAGQPFSRQICLALDACYLMNGLPIDNSRGQVAGYVLAYRLDAEYAGRALSTLTAFLLASLLTLGLALVIVRHKHTQRRLLTLSEHVGKGIYVLDRSGRITYANPAACTLLGYPPEELLGQDAHTLFHDTSAGAHLSAEDCPIRKVTWEGKVFQGDKEVFRARDGTFIPVEVTSSPISEAGEITSVVTVFADIRERLRHIERLRQSDAAFQAASEGVMITDAQAHIVAINPAFTQLTGYESTEVLGRDPRFLASGRHPRTFYTAMWEKLAKEGVWQGEIYNKRKDGSIFPEWLSIASIRDEQGRTSSYVAVFNDISELKDKEARLSFLAHYDTLTRLPNRILLRQLLRQNLQRKQQEGGLLAVLFVDMDRFKPVNDSLGHDAGDQLIRAAAERIRGCLQHEDTLARQGGDEFVILLERIQESQAAVQLAGKIIAALKPAFHLHGFEEQAVFIGASIGISLYPQDGRDESTLLRQADAAMVEAKAAGGDTWRFSNPDLGNHAVARLRMEAELRQALETQAFELHFQPKVALADAHVHGLEALIRWRHPERGLLAPGAFLPVAQASRLIADIGDWVLRESIRQLAEWRAAGIPIVCVWVNVDGSQLARGDLPQQVERALAAAALEPHWLGLEITETAIMAQPQQVIPALETLRALGVGLSIDDFGTGHSSLNRLKQLPIDVLKIDASFVRDMAEDASDRAIVAATIALAQALGLATVAEGVETAEQLAMLLDMGCAYVQGYYLARPMPAAMVAAMLSDNDFAQRIGAVARPSTRP